ncbi:SEC-C motif-containing protein [Desulfuromusa kysingii]|uniref:SEC-C motif-containing protein n=1 Tax=Desulfuromusa kysingii TaxID=37625 RepID=A0A1H4BDR6_9BACT|nr:SEC-C motif-containing protein [Desulfuromusa kysingii]
MGLFRRLFKSKEKEDLGPAPPTVLPMRNDPCWCNSGLKYKKCHLEQDQIYLEKLRLKKKEASKSCSPKYG